MCKYRPDGKQARACVRARTRVCLRTLWTGHGLETPTEPACTGVRPPSTLASTPSTLATPSTKCVEGVGGGVELSWPRLDGHTPARW